MPNNRHELLPIVIQQDNALIDARLLHKKLKSGYQFSDWIKTRIKEFQFEENKDFFASEKTEAKRGGSNAIDYLLTIDMAKELAMLERNEVGREIRRYFIAKEKELRGISQLPREAAIFKGLKKERINGRTLYPYRALLAAIGYNSTAGSAGTRLKTYPGHFVKMGNVQLISEEFALHLYHQRRVLNNRQVMREMQPVLPFNFGHPLKTIAHESN